MHNGLARNQVAQRLADAMPWAIPKCEVVACGPSRPLQRGITVSLWSKRIHIVTVEVTVAAKHIRRASNLDTLWHMAAAQLNTTRIVDPAW